MNVAYGVRAYLPTEVKDSKGLSCEDSNSLVKINMSRSGVRRSGIRRSWVLDRPENSESRSGVLASRSGIGPSLWNTAF